MLSADCSGKLGRRNPDGEVGLYLVGVAEVRRGRGLLQGRQRSGRSRGAREVGHVSHLIHCHKVTHVEGEVLVLLFLLILLPLSEKQR